MAIGVSVTTGRLQVCFLAALIYLLACINAAAAQDSDAKNDDRPSVTAATDAEPAEAKEADADAS